MIQIKNFTKKQEIPSSFCYCGLQANIEYVIGEPYLKCGSSFNHCSFKQYLDALQDLQYQVEVLTKSIEMNKQQDNQQLQYAQQHEYDQQYSMQIEQQQEIINQDFYNNDQNNFNADNQIVNKQQYEQEEFIIPEFEEYFSCSNNDSNNEYDSNFEFN